VFVVGNETRLRAPDSLPHARSWRTCRAWCRACTATAWRRSTQPRRSSASSSPSVRRCSSRPAGKPSTALLLLLSDVSFAPKLTPAARFAHPPLCPPAEKSPPIDEVIQTNVVPRFVQFLHRVDVPLLQVRHCRTRRRLLVFRVPPLTSNSRPLSLPCSSRRPGHSPTSRLARQTTHAWWWTLARCLSLCSCWVA
jgi:hypothetical protein